MCSARACRAGSPTARPMASARATSSFAASRRPLTACTYPRTYRPPASGRWAPAVSASSIPSSARSSAAGIRAVDDHVPAVREDALDVLGRQPLLVRDDLHVRIERLDRALGRVHLGLAEPLSRV